MHSVNRTLISKASKPPLTKSLVTKAAPATAIQARRAPVTISKNIIMEQYLTGAKPGYKSMSSISTASSSHSNTLFEPTDGNLARVRTEIQAIWEYVNSENHASSHSSSSTSSETVKTKSICKYKDRSSPWFQLDRDLSSDIAGETGAVWIYVGADRALRHRRFLKEFISNFGKNLKFYSPIIFQQGSSGTNNFMNSSINNSTIKFSSSDRTFSKIQKRSNLDLAAEEFVSEHLVTEQKHLTAFEIIYKNLDHKHTKLLPIWKICGFFLGYLPTIFKGPVYLFHTVDAVETFVEKHYQEQIEFLKAKFLNDSKKMARIMGDNGIIHDPQTNKPTFALLGLLKSFQDDEVMHKDDARERLRRLVIKSGSSGDSTESFSNENNNSMNSKNDFGFAARSWRWIVGTGSFYAAELAKKI